MKILKLRKDSRSDSESMQIEILNLMHKYPKAQMFFMFNLEVEDSEVDLTEGKYFVVSNNVLKEKSPSNLFDQSCPKGDTHKPEVIGDSFRFRCSKCGEVED